MKSYSLTIKFLGLVGYTFLNNSLKLSQNGSVYRCSFDESVDASAGYMVKLCPRTTTNKCRGTSQQHCWPKTQQTLTASSNGMRSQREAATEEP